MILSYFFSRNKRMVPVSAGTCSPEGKYQSHPQRCVCADTIERFMSLHML